MDKKIIEFLKHSNYIEAEYSKEALEDAKKAWEYAYLMKDHISLSYILGIHYILMKRLRPYIAGKVRNCDVRVGGKIKLFINQECLHHDLNRWKIENWTKKHPENIKESHIWFEGIHPFKDGNGRVGRILYNIQRINAGLDIHIIHEGKEQMEYYKWFNNN